MRKLLIVLSIAGIAAVGGACFLWTYLPKNRIPAAALHALENDPKLVLYSLDPQRLVFLDSGEVQPLSDDVPKFHGYRILGQTTLASSESQRVVVKTIREGVRNWDGRVNACFEPRHGIRVTDASGTYDFLVCFTCHQIYVFLPGDVRSGVCIRASPKPLNDILTAAHVPLPTQ
jgi:hypothetical protein